MAKGTDLCASGAQSLTDEQKSVTAQGLALAAAHLASMDPSKPVNGIDFAALLGAKLYDAGGRSGAGGGVRMLRAALNTIGDVPEGVTRVEFAVPVAQAARTFGYDWAADDNRHLFPAMTGDAR